MSVGCGGPQGLKETWKKTSCLQSLPSVYLISTTISNTHYVTKSCAGTGRTKKNPRPPISMGLKYLDRGGTNGNAKTSMGRAGSGGLPPAPGSWSSEGDGAVVLRWDPPIGMEGWGGASGIGVHSPAAGDTVPGPPSAAVPPPYASVPWGSCSVLEHAPSRAGQPPAGPAGAAPAAKLPQASGNLCGYSDCFLDALPARWPAICSSSLPQLAHQRAEAT